MNPRQRLFRKYVVPIIGVVGIALVASGAISVYFSYVETRNALLALEREKAASAALRIEQFAREIEHQIGWTSLPQIAEGQNPLELRRFDYVKLLRQVPAITEASFIDKDGREQVRVSRLAMDVLGAEGDLSKDPRFAVAKTGKTYFGPVYFRKETEPYMAIAMRAGRDGAGVTAVEVNLKFIWEVVQRIRIGESGLAYVVNRDGHLVAHPDISLVLQKTDLSALPQVKTALASTLGEDDRVTDARDRAGRAVLTGFARIESLGWTVFVEQPAVEAYAPLYATLARMGAVLLVGLTLAVLASLALARRMVRPINALQDGAAAIGAGDLDKRIEVRTGDELQDLAEKFNSMADQLRESYLGLERKVAVRTSELQETLERQTATAEILNVIAGSPSDVQPVFDTIVKSALALCKGMYANVFRYDGTMLHFMATESQDPRVLEILKAKYPMRPDTSQISGRVILTKSIARIEDSFLDPDYDPSLVGRVGWRRMLGLPMLREGKPLGVIVVTWDEPGPIVKHHEELLQTFADQAVIAIENVRLFNETREALEQQTATAEILKVISGSPTDVQPVFEAIVRSGVHLFEGAAVAVVRPADGKVHLMAIAEGDPERAKLWASRFPFPLAREYMHGKAILDAELLEVPDILRAGDQFPLGQQNFLPTGYRAVTVAPMMRGVDAVGAISVIRLSPGPLSAKQASMLRTFSDQAVIAIENVRLFNEIQEKSRQLEIADKHKSEFLANMSHELRTPLNAIIGFSEVLVERYFGELNEKQAEYAADIHSSGKHLLSLINDILDLSKIEAGRMELDLSEFDMKEALENAMTLVRERAQRHGISLKLDIAPDLGTLRADERKVKQIMLNLLSNAVKFTPEGGSVSVCATRGNGAAEVAVTDTGVGIAAEDQETVFEEFRQVGNDYTRKAEGTGLGLSLARRFAELHGGTIRLASSLGQGSTFTLVIPTEHGQ